MEANATADDSISSLSMYIGCASCYQWFHPQELGLTPEETAVAKQAEQWHCPQCNGEADWNEEWDEEQLYCICQQHYDDLCYLNCVSCDDWFHPQCVGLVTEQQEMEVDGELWQCPSCASSARPAKRQLADLDEVGTSKRPRGSGKGSGKGKQTSQYNTGDTRMQ